MAEDATSSFLRGLASGLSTSIQRMQQAKALEIREQNLARQREMLKINLAQFGLEQDKVDLMMQKFDQQQSQNQFQNMIALKNFGIKKANLELDRQEQQRETNLQNQILADFNSNGPTNLVPFQAQGPQQVGQGQTGSLQPGAQPPAGQPQQQPAEQQIQPFSSEQLLAPEQGVRTPPREIATTNVTPSNVPIGIMDESGQQDLSGVEVISSGQPKSIGQQKPEQPIKPTGKITNEQQFQSFVDQVENRLTNTREVTKTISAGGVSLSKKQKTFTEKQAFQQITQVFPGDRKSPEFATNLYKALRNRSIRNSEPAQKFFEQAFESKFSNEFLRLKREFLKTKKNLLPPNKKALEAKAVANVAAQFADYDPIQGTLDMFVPKDRQDELTQTPDLEFLPEEVAAVISSDQNVDINNLDDQDINRALEKIQEQKLKQAVTTGEAGAKLHMEKAVNDLILEKREKQNSYVELIRQNNGLGGAIGRAIERNPGGVESLIDVAGGVNGFINDMINAGKGLLSSITGAPTAKNIIAQVEKDPQRAGKLMFTENRWAQLEQSQQELFTRFFIMTVRAAEAFGIGLGRALSDKDFDRVQESVGAKASGLPGLLEAIQTIDHVSRERFQSLEKEIESLEAGKPQELPPFTGIPQINQSQPGQQQQQAPQSEDELIKLFSE